MYFKLLTGEVSFFVLRKLFLIIYKHHFQQQTSLLANTENEHKNPKYPAMPIFSMK